MSMHQICKFCGNYISERKSCDVNDCVYRIMSLDRFESPDIQEKLDHIKSLESKLSYYKRVFMESKERSKTHIDENDILKMKLYECDNEKYRKYKRFYNDVIGKLGERDDTIGFVYIIKAAGYHKIGISKNVQNRLANLQTSNPERLDLVYSREVYYCNYHESHLHRRFERKRATGEWFNLSHHDVIAVEKYLKGQEAPNTKRLSGENKQIGLTSN